MKRKVLAIFLSIAIIVTLLIPSTLVKAEPNEKQGQEEVTDETTQKDENQIIEEEGSEGEAIEDESAQQPNENQENEIAINSNSYDPILYKVILYTLQKTTEDSITTSELESINKIDVEELQKDHSDLENITISSFLLLQHVTNLEELNLGNLGWNTLKALNLGDNSWDGIEALSKLPKLNKLKINGCTFTAIQPETTISKDLLSKLKIVKDTTENAQVGDKILEIQLDDFTITENNKHFTIPNINEMKSIDQLDDIDKSNALSSEIVSSYQCSINNYEVTFSSETFEESQFPIEIKLSSNRVKAIIKVNILVDESLLTIKDNGENPKPEDENKDESQNTAPVINASDKTIKIGEVFDPLDGVSATDAEDGDITEKIVVDDSKVDINTSGTYEVIYSVKDSSDEEITLKVNLIVEEQQKEEGENNIPIIEANDKTIKVGEVFDPLDGVSAKDKNGKDITNKIEVIENGVNSNEVGKYSVTYSVKDDNNIEATKTIQVTVQKGEEVVNTAPVINAENKIIELGSKFDALEGVTATDEEDGDITNRIKIVSSNVDVNTEGVYVVTYEVTDKDGASSRKNVDITVMKPITDKNEGPVINASDRTIKIGEKFNPLDGVTAYDKEDGDITSKIEVVENMVDINSIGKYSVTFEVTDSAGVKSSKSINVKVDKAAVEVNRAPKISASNKVIKAESKFNPYSGVTAIDYEDGDITNKVKVIYNNLNTNVIGLYRIIYEVTDSGGYKVTKTIYVNVIPKSNTRPIIYVDNIIVSLGSRYNPYAMVSAYDKEDGNITGSIIVVYNYVNVYKEGTYKVGYKVTDSMGMSASCVVKVTVKNYYGKEDINKNQDPVIYTNDISVALNSKFNPLEWVAATDKEDGDITNRVMVIVNDVDTSVEGNYHVTYEVVDSSGNKVNKAMMVYVKKEEVVKEENVAPVINAEDLTIEKGMYFDPLDGVTALDDEDGNLTHKIIIEENEVNVSKSGVYKVTYEVTDSMGETTSKSIIVTVEGNNSIINYELFVKIGGVLIIILLIGSVASIVVTRKKQ